MVNKVKCGLLWGLLNENFIFILSQHFAMIHIDILKQVQMDFRTKRHKQGTSMDLNTKNKSPEKPKPILGAIRWILFCSAGLIILTIILIMVANVAVIISSLGKMYEPNISGTGLIPKKTYAIVLGASVRKDELAAVYELRVMTALDLYKKGLVDKILITGDGQSKYYNEIKPALKYLTDRGVSPEDIVTDSLGLDTYDSIQRASQIYGINDAIIVSQGFHIPRATYIAESQGIDVVGAVAPDASVDSYVFGSVREWWARVKAFLEVTFD